MLHLVGLAWLDGRAALRLFFRGGAPQIDFPFVGRTTLRFHDRVRKATKFPSLPAASDPEESGRGGAELARNLRSPIYYPALPADRLSKTERICPFSFYTSSGGIGGLSPPLDILPSSFQH